jgi:hypothetical protein
MDTDRLNADVARRQGTLMRLLKRTNAFATNGTARRTTSSSRGEAVGPVFTDKEKAVFRKRGDHQQRIDVAPVRAHHLDPVRRRIDDGGLGALPRRAGSREPRANRAPGFAPRPTASVHGARPLSRRGAGLDRLARARGANRGGSSPEGR